MKILPLSFLLISSLFASKFLEISQSGPDWEIPNYILYQGGNILGFSAMFLILSLIFLFIPKCHLLDMRSGGKLIFVLWEIAVLLIIVLGSNNFLYQLRGRSIIISNIIKNSFYPGIIISIVIFGIILLINKKNH